MTGSSVLRWIKRNSYYIPLALLVILLGVQLFDVLEPECLGGTCPSLDDITSYEPPEPAHIYDRDGRLVAHLSGQRRMVASMARIDPLLAKGFVAVEDRRFYEHDGVDFLGILRAAARNVTAGSVEEGASTITMQLARNVFGEEVLEYGRWRRKITEASLASELEARLTKERILELYLNQIYLGDGIYGVETAARHFFGKPASDLTPAEAALIVGLAKNPEGYNPRKDPERARERRNVVLGIFEQTGLLEPEVAEKARADEIRVVEPSATWESSSSYASAVRRELRDLIPDARTRNGVRVYTGLDTRLQAVAESLLVAQIQTVEAGRYGPYQHPVPEGELAPVEGETSPFLQGMFLALDATTGEVRAVVGGRDFGHSQFDRAFLARRQPGSAFKPIVYYEALHQGLRLSDLVETGEISLVTDDRQVWSPREGLVPDDEMSVRRALARSSNRATVRIGQTAGVEAVVELAHRMGLTTAIPPYPSIFLGSAEVVPAELVAAYASFANGGFRVHPHLITRVEDREGRTIWRAETEAERVLEPAPAFLTLEALRDVVDSGTGWRVREAGFRGVAAGKTGTTDEGKDAWFVGVTPELVAGVWLGFDQPRPILQGATGGELAAPVWGRFMREAYRDRPAPEPWRAPAGVVRREVDTNTGYLATEHCPGNDVVNEYFAEGTAPEEYCPLHEGGFLQRLFRSIRGGDGNGNGGGGGDGNGNGDAGGEGNGEGSGPP